MRSASQDITELLAAAGNGDGAATDRLLPLVYDQLRQMAGDYLRHERADHTLQATALVHEAYLKLVDQTRVQWQNRAHFLAVAATAMRRILVNHARDLGRFKRGGGLKETTLDESAVVGPDSGVDLIGLDEAMNKLAVVDPRKSRIVELRYFGGLSVEETAEALGIGSATVKRDWNFAKTWLLRELAA